MSGAREHWAQLIETIGKAEFRQRARGAMFRRTRNVTPEVADDARWSAELSTVHAGLVRLSFRLYWIAPLGMVPAACGMVLAVAPSAARWVSFPLGYQVPAHLWWILLAGGALPLIALTVALGGLLRLAWALEFGGPAIRGSLNRALASIGVAASGSALITLLGLLVLPSALGFPPLMAVVLAVVLLPMPLIALLVSAQAFRFATRFAAEIDEVEAVLMTHSPLSASV